MNAQEYAIYRTTNHWREFSQMMREEAGGCQECGITDTLNVHHLHYRTLHHESRDDVVVLCERCHMNTHILERRMKMFGIKDHEIVGTAFVDRRNAVQKQIEESRKKKGGFGL